MTAREWQELNWLIEHESLGDDRRDLGLAKAVTALVTALGRKIEDPTTLLPIQPPRPELTPEEEFAALEAAWPSH